MKTVNYIKKLTKHPMYIYPKVVQCSQKYRQYKLNNNYLLSIFFSFFQNRNIHKYGIEINGKVGKNLIIYHGNIIINENAILGDNVKLHGTNCIGNNGKNDKAPQIGDNVDIGWGTCIIGDIKIANNITIGANSVVTKSFLSPGITIAGNPAREISVKK